MRCTIAIIALALAAPGGARAGAWMRGEGETFLSAAVNLRHDGARFINETDIYAEHGLTARLTLGASLFEAAGSGHVLAFLRVPAPVSRHQRLALEFGAGAWHRDSDWHGLARLTLAYGRSLKWGRANGWLSVESAAEYRAGLADPMFKLDATIGQSDGGRLRPMFKLGATHIPGRPLIWQASAHLLIDGPPGTTWNIGIERKQAGAASTALILGVWRRF